MSRKFDKYQILIDGRNPLFFADNDNFEARVDTILRQIMINPVGKIIIELLPKEKNLTISPFKKGVCSAITKNKNFWNKEEFKIEYSPETWRSGTPCNPSQQNKRFGMDADEVLCHELIHANRYMRNKWSPMNIDEAEGYKYENIEDFLAITLTNVYSSANGKKEFRRDHTQPPGTTKLPENDSTSNGFLTYSFDNYRFMQFLSTQDSLLFSQIANLNEISFNPFKEFKALESRK